MAKKNNGAPGIDGVTFEVIEESGVDVFVEQIRVELVSHTYRPMRGRKVEIPKGNGKTRTLSIPTIRDRVVQGALKLILEPIFEADFQPGSFGYRPRKTAHEAVNRVANAVVRNMLHVIDLDLRAYFDNVRQDVLLEKVARRVNDDDIMALLKLVLRASGKKGVPQGGVISPLLSNIYLNEVDRMLEKAKEVTKRGEYMQIEYARFADDLVVLVSAHPRQRGLPQLVARRVREELAKLHVEVNEEKTRTVDLAKGEVFGFVGFDFRALKNPKGRWWAYYVPKMKKRTELLRELKRHFLRQRSQPLERVVENINPILRGWVNYFAIGHSFKTFMHIQRWVENKVGRHLMRAQGLRGRGWRRWSTSWLYDEIGMFNAYRIKRFEPRPKAFPAC